MSYEEGKKHLAYYETEVTVRYYPDGGGNSSDAHYGVTYNAPKTVVYGRNAVLCYRLSKGSANVRFTAADSVASPVSGMASQFSAPLISPDGGALVLIDSNSNIGDANLTLSWIDSAGVIFTDDPQVGNTAKPG